jgi:GT2 family glycosyltransferase
MDVAVIIVNWNSGALLGRCLAALDAQTARPAEIVVVDNASADGSEQAAVRPGVRLIRSPENTGFAAANNLALATTRASWVALLNPDAFPESTWLERLAEAASRNEGYSFFATRLICADAPERVDGAGDVYAVNGLAWRRHHGGLAASTGLSGEEVFAPCGAAALYRRDALLEVEGFDERFFCYFEDVDLAFRLRLLGHRCLYVPEAVVHHVGSAMTGRRSAFSVYHGHRNLVWTYVKNMPWPLFLAYLPQHLLLNVATMVWFTLRGQGRVILAAKRDALLGLPRVWRQRRGIQARRRVGPLELRRTMARGLTTAYVGRSA